jgi:8-oxo-dGTP pyrophosphatase MutT (NUDIX family)
MPMDKEFAAGGIVSREDSLLLVEATNLKGERVWTFPKGHPEKGETPETTALREVQEETGWRCKIRSELMTVAYKFSRQGRLVDKKVQWFWMEPVEKVGEPDAVEIRDVKWLSSDEAFDVLKYPSDLELLVRWKKEAFTERHAEPRPKAAAKKRKKNG